MIDVNRNNNEALDIPNKVRFPCSSYYINKLSILYHNI